MTKINHEEYEVLKELDAKWKWIARDEDRGLYAFTEKPVRNYGPSPYWWDKEGWDAEPYSAIDLFDEKHLFQFIQWEDGEPYNIAELIKEYESSLIESTPWTPNPLDFESEDIGVKDKKWLIKRVENYIPINDKTVGQVVDNILDIIHQLDEPEVLSQEWIEFNTWTNHYVGDPFVYVDDLQNLLVPKQELPVIPQFVADWVEDLKSKEINLLTIYDFTHGEDINDYMREQSDTLMRAWLDGYEVEEEQKYYVSESDEEYGGFWFLTKNKNGDISIGVGRDCSEVDWDRLKLTEQEIKDYDSRYWAFAKKVEELEEE